MAVRVGINGFGRIGRQVYKAIEERLSQDIQVVAVNDLTDATTLGHLLKYDSTYGIYPGTVEVQGSKLIVNGKEITILSEKQPAALPWRDMDVDIVVESTGIFTKREGAQQHLDAGAKKVIISAPAKGEDLTIVLGVNEDKYDPQQHHIISNASCTTNGLAPVAKVVFENYGIVHGLMTTVHAYTNDQRILDLPHKDLRRARAAALNIIPTSTGAAKALQLVIPELAGKFDGFSLRVPTPTVSIIVFIADVEKATSVEDLNGKLRAAADGKMKGILGFTEEPLVSTDFRGDERSSIVDGQSTMVMDGTMVQVVTWYDNEWGYSCRVADLVGYLVQKGL